MVKLQDIAKACGYDTATVSRALGGATNVKEETRKTIVKVAKEMNYVPNSIAKKLKMQKSWNIAVSLDLQSNRGLKHYFFTDILNAFLESVSKSGYDITFITKDMHDDNLLAHCKSRMFDGVFIVSCDFEAHSVQELLKSDMPVVIVENKDEIPFDMNVSCVTSNNRNIMFDMVDHIIKKGHKDVVYITGEDIFVTRERVKGFKKALEHNGIEFHDDMMIASKYSDLNYISESMDRLLEREKLPTALFIPDDCSAIAVYNKIRTKGLKIPDDISVIGFDGIELGQSIFPRLTTVKQDTEAIAGEASSRLIAMIEGKQKKDLFIKIVDAVILDGESVKDLNS